MTRALIVVDIQNDFVEGGSLPVEGGIKLGYLIANAISSLKSFGLYDHVVATKDFHLPGDSNGGHISDNPNYVSTWPSHCIQGTTGAMFVPQVEAIADDFEAIFYKGQGRADYSGFQGVDVNGDHLYTWLTARNVDSVDVIGIATDHCVKVTAEDAIMAGFATRIPALLTVAVGGPDAVVDTIEKINRMQGLNRRIN